MPVSFAFLSETFFAYLEPVFIFYSGSDFNFYTTFIFSFSILTSAANLEVGIVRVYDFF